MSDTVTRTIRIIIDIEAEGASAESLKEQLDANLNSAINQGLLDVGDGTVTTYNCDVLSHGDSHAVDVGHWDEAHPRAADPENRFSNDLSDQRLTNGQVFQSIRLRETPPESDLQLHVMTEINSLHGDDLPLPCAHISTDDDDHTTSIFRRGDGLILRLDTGVGMTRTTLPDGSTGYLIA